MKFENIQPPGARYKFYNLSGEVDLFELRETDRGSNIEKGLEMVIPTPFREPLVPLMAASVRSLFFNCVSYAMFQLCSISNQTIFTLGKQMWPGI